jgi:single-stranded DNA-binding protein
MTYAKLILLGYAGQPPTVRTSGDNTIVSFLIGIHKKDKKTEKYETDWYYCTSFNPPDVLKTLKKGQQILVEGLPRMGEYEKEGQKIRTFNVLVDRFVLIGGKEDARNDG